MMAPSQWITSPPSVSQSQAEMQKLPNWAEIQCQTGTFAMSRTPQERSRMPTRSVNVSPSTLIEPSSRQDCV